MALVVFLVSNHSVKSFLMVLVDLTVVCQNLPAKESLVDLLKDITLLLYVHKTTSPSGCLCVFKR